MPLTASANSSPEIQKDSIPRSLRVRATRRVSQIFKRGSDSKPHAEDEDHAHTHHHHHHHHNDNDEADSKHTRDADLSLLPPSPSPPTGRRTSTGAGIRVRQKLMSFGSAADIFDTPRRGSSDDASVWVQYEQANLERHTSKSDNDSPDVAGAKAVLPLIQPSFPVDIATDGVLLSSAQEPTSLSVANGSSPHKTLDVPAPNLQPSHDHIVQDADAVTQPQADADITPANSLPTTGDVAENKAPEHKAAEIESSAGSGKYENGELDTEKRVPEMSAVLSDETPTLVYEDVSSKPTLPHTEPTQDVQEESPSQAERVASDLQTDNTLDVSAQHQEASVVAQPEVDAGVQESDTDIQQQTDVVITPFTSLLTANGVLGNKKPASEVVDTADSTGSSQEDRESMKENSVANKEISSDSSANSTLGTNDRTGEQMSVVGDKTLDVPAPNPQPSHDHPDVPTQPQADADTTLANVLSSAGGSDPEPAVIGTGDSAGSGKENSQILNEKHTIAVKGIPSDSSVDHTLGMKDEIGLEQLGLSGPNGHVFAPALPPLNDAVEATAEEILVDDVVSAVGSTDANPASTTPAPGTTFLSTEPLEPTSSAAEKEIMAGSAVLSYDVLNLVAGDTPATLPEDDPFKSTLSHMKPITLGSDIQDAVILPSIGQDRSSTHNNGDIHKALGKKSDSNDSEFFSAEEIHSHALADDVFLPSATHAELADEESVAETKVADNGDEEEKGRNIDSTSPVEFCLEIHPASFESSPLLPTVEIHPTSFESSPLLLTAEQNLSTDGDDDDDVDRDGFIDPRSPIELQPTFFEPSPLFVRAAKEKSTSISHNGEEKKGEARIELPSALPTESGTTNTALLSQSPTALLEATRRIELLEGKLKDMEAAFAAMACSDCGGKKGCAQPAQPAQASPRPVDPVVVVAPVRLDSSERPRVSPSTSAAFKMTPSISMSTEYVLMACSAIGMCCVAVKAVVGGAQR